MKKCYLIFCTLLLMHQLAFAQSESLLTARAGFSLVPPPAALAAQTANSHIVPNYIPAALTVTGIVKDENGQGFPGVNIIVKGTSSGTTTDVNGRYTLQVENDNATLVFSFVGYKEQEIALAGRT